MSSFRPTARTSTGVPLETRSYSMAPTSTTRWSKTVGAGGIGSMRWQIRCWKGWRRKHERLRKSCGSSQHPSPPPSAPSTVSAGAGTCSTLKESLNRCREAMIKNHATPHVPPMSEPQDPTGRAPAYLQQSRCARTPEVHVAVSESGVQTHLARLGLTLHQGHGGPLMTKVQAAYLRAIWNALGSPLCEHRKIDVERSEDGHMTGNSRCLACGYAVAR